MLRTAQAHLDALGTHYPVRVQTLRSRRTGDVTSVVVTWRAHAEVQPTAAAALAALVAKVYVWAGLTVPAEARQPALPGVR